VTRSTIRIVSLAVGVGVETVVPAAAVFADGSVGVFLLDRRSLVDQPLRRRRRRRAQHRLHAVVADELDGLIKPLEIECTPLGLEDSPRELRHPYVFEAGVGHRSDIAFPLFARPMFGKVTDSETHSASSQPRHLSVRID